MRNRVEYILGGMTILQGLLVGVAWNGKKWAFLLLTLLLFLQEMVLILFLVRKRYQKSFVQNVELKLLFGIGFVLIVDTYSNLDVKKKI